MSFPAGGHCFPQSRPFPVGAGQPVIWIVKEAVEDFLYGRHLKGSTIRREELVLRDLAEHARLHSIVLSSDHSPRVAGTISDGDHLAAPDTLHEQFADIRAGPRLVLGAVSRRLFIQLRLLGSRS